MLKLEIVTDGTPAGTHIVDADTGEVVEFDAHASCDVRAEKDGTGEARLVLVFPDLPVKVSGALSGQCLLLGADCGGRSGPPPRPKLANVQTASERAIPVADAFPLPGNAPREKR